MWTSSSPATTVATATVGAGRANEIVLKQLGAVAIGAARLERLAAEVALSLKLRPDAGRAADAIRAGSFTIPPWTATKQADVVAWARAASKLLDTRTAVFAACGGSRFTGTRGDTIATESSDGSVFPADEEFLSRLATRLERHLAAGVELHAALDYQDEKGRRWPIVSIYRRAAEEPSDAVRLPLEWTRWLTA